MVKEKGKNVWLMMLILSCLLMAYTAFAISGGDSVLENGAKQFGVHRHPDDL